MSVETKSKPALTAEDWAEVFEDWGLAVADYAVPAAEEEKYHRAAALCLHNQPFGFTREDVERLKKLAPAMYENGVLRRDPLRDFVLDLADRIEALLPPEATDVG